MLMALSLFTLLLAPGARAAELVVIEATGTSLKAGQTIDDRERLVLKDGEQVSLVGEDGNVRKLRGPYDRAPGAASEGGVEISKALAALTSGQRSEYGVIRSKVDNVNLPTPWVVDVTHSGKVCVRPGSAVVFWRQQAAGAVKLRILPADRSWRAEAEWPAGASQLTAPSNFPIGDRQTYLVDAGGTSATITLVQVPASLSTDRMRAAWMLEKNCLSQTKALILTMQ